MTNKASKAVAINLIENHIEHDLSDKQDMTRNKQRGMSDYDTTTASQEPQVPAHHLLARRWKRPECLWGHRAAFLSFRRMNCLPGLAMMIGFGFGVDTRKVKDMRSSVIEQLIKVSAVLVFIQLQAATVRCTNVFLTSLEGNCCNFVIPKKHTRF